MAGSLTGLRVVDLSTSIAGIQASQHLADNGASVLFVEPPGGSPWRRHPSWPLWGRGKSSWEVDLHAAESLTAVRGAICSADVLIETFRPGVADRLGLGYTSFGTDAPQLVYGSITGFGTTGRYSHVRGYEGTVMAALGIMHSYRVLANRPGPAFASPWMCSASAAQLLLQGVLASVYERESSGLGQHVETSLVEAIASQDLNNLMHLVLRRRYPDAFHAAPFVSPEGVPNSGRAFRTLVALTADGRWLQFGQLSERLFHALMEALELDWMFESPEWKTAPDFEDEQVRLSFWEQMLRAARQKSLSDWQTIFSNKDVWAEVYRTGSELLSHPQMVADHRIAEARDEQGQPVVVPGLLVHLDKTPGEASTDTSAISLQGEPTFPDQSWTEGTCAGEETSAPPLAGVTILELGMYFAGPLAATMLADLGARVIKVEPFEGDPARSFTGFPEAGGTRTMQGKESMAVDLQTAEGRSLVLQLAASSDVVLQSFRAGVAERLGIDAKALLAHNPSLVYVDAPGYGTSGPCCEKPSFAPTMGAASGFAMRNMGNAVPEGPELSPEAVKHFAAKLFPATILVGHADAFAAQAVATAILLGLIARKRGAGGQRLETSMISSMAHVLSDQMVGSSTAEGWYQRSDESLMGAGPLYRLYQCHEGWVFLAITRENEWDAFRRQLACSELDLITLAEAQDRAAEGPAVEALLEALFAARPATEWERQLLAVDVACVVAAGVPPEEVLVDNLLGTEGGFTTEVVHPLWDDHPRLAPAIRLSRSETLTPAGVLCGQHTDPILQELGHTEVEIADLRSRNVVR
jgi:crotonobetainyl-CoA:carnitine CoA-transferase CaiB-like acyl-CoA transferase